MIAVLLMARKFGVPVCPHAGGVGLCEYVQHLSIFDYVRVGASLEDPSAFCAVLRLSVSSLRADGRA